MKTILRKITLLMLTLSLCFGTMLVNVMAEDVDLDYEVTEHPDRVIDEAGIISDSVESDIRRDCDRISEKYNTDVAIVTLDTFYDGYSQIRDMADDMFDYWGYGLGSDRAGVMLVLVMDTRDWWITTRGYGIKAFTDAGIKYIEKNVIKEYFSDDDFDGGFSCFVDTADDFLRQAETGKPYDTGNLPKGKFPALKYIFIALIVGLIISAIVVMTMKSKLKSVRFNNEAANYVRPGSLNITDGGEFYLYTHVSRRAKPKSSSGGSSTHISSSGASHGGGGGKF